MIAACYDIPHVQAQVGHVDPTTTLGIYAQLMARADRDQLRSDLRVLLGVAGQPTATDTLRSTNVAWENPLRSLEKAGKGRSLLP